MRRMNVDYDLLTWEGDILRLHFWAHAFDVLKAKRAVYLQTEGRLKGCWVMPIQEDLDANPKAQSPNPKSQEPIGSRIPDPAPPPEDDDEEREKVIVRSNGVVTYVGKDIAYQFWKLGLLGKDFHYRCSNSVRSGRCGQRLRAVAKVIIPRMAALPTSTTSSTSVSRICRSC
jgi:arginyl-tRNA synthetase